MIVYTCILKTFHTNIGIIFDKIHVFDLSTYRFM